LVTPEYQHVTLVQQVMFATGHKLDLAAFAGQVFSRAGLVRYPDHFYDADGNDWEFVQYFSDNPLERNDYELPDSG